MTKALEVLWLLSLVAGSATVQGNSAAGTCQNILNAGVYNTFMQSQSGSSYAQYKQAYCTDYSSYTYDQYILDTATSQAQGNAWNFNLAVRVLFVKVSTSTGGSSYFQTASEFYSAKTAINALRTSNCGSSDTVSADSATMTTLQQVLDPAPYAAYQQCISLFAAGVRVSMQMGTYGRSVALDVKFVPNQPGAYATFNGMFISPAGTATCTVKGQDSPNAVSARASKDGRDSSNATDSTDASELGQHRLLQQVISPTGTPPAQNSTSTYDPFRFRLTPYAIYTFFCELTGSAAASDTSTDIYISTSVGGTVRTMLQPSASPSQLNVLRSQVSALESSLAALQARGAELEAKIASLVARGEAQEGKVANLLYQVASQQTKIVLLTNKVDKLNINISDGTMNPVRACFGTMCLRNTDSSGNDLLVVKKDGSSLSARFAFPEDGNLDVFQAFTAPLKGQATKWFFVNTRNEMGLWDDKTGRYTGALRIPRWCPSTEFWRC